MRVRAPGMLESGDVENTEWGVASTAGQLVDSMLPVHDNPKAILPVVPGT